MEGVVEGFTEKFMLAHGLLSCVSAVFGVCFSGLLGGGGGPGGGGGVDNVQVAYIVRYRLRIPRYLQALARLSLKVVVFDGAEFYVVPPKTLHTTVTT